MKSKDEHELMSRVDLLPDGWEERESKSTRRVYFYNRSGLSAKAFLRAHMPVLGTHALGAADTPG